MDKLLRILIVDDNAEDRARTRDELNKEFVVQVHEARNAETLDKALESGPFDMVITDSRHHWTTWLDLLKKIKARYPACPVIMFTDTGNEEIAVEAMKNGIDDYVVKSARPGRLNRAVRGVMEKAQEAQERKRAEETIKYEAYHDLLTGLPNKELFLLYLDLELNQARRSDYKIAIVLLDVDRLKNLNDSLGRLVGDRLLKEVASRVRASIRKSDRLARIGGDEFGILLSDLRRAEDVIVSLREIKLAMNAAFRIDSHQLYVTLSFGISMFPEDGQDAETLLRNAGKALSQAKETGQNSHHFFNPSLDKRTAERLILENSLRNSIERNELVVYYQPQIDVSSSEIAGLEALVRWKHTELGVLKPEQFIPLAEEMGFIAKIDQWVLRAACEQNKAWQKAGLKAVPVSVNMSSDEFLDLYLPGNVSRVLEQTRLNPEYLKIEITESTAMRQVELSLLNLHALKKMGVRLAIDDFGTGFSSLSYLKQFPIHGLKIDKSFIKGIASEAGDQAIVDAVIALGKSLNLQVIAEGVENDEQFAFLKAKQCKLIQGFIVTEPLPAGRIESLLRQEKVAA